MSFDSFVLDFPLDRPHCGIPIANGNMGVLVWGEGCRLCLTVNRSDFWDHRFGERIEPGTNYQHMVQTFDPMDITPTQAMFTKRTMPYDHKGIWWRSSRLPMGRFELTLTSQLINVKLDYSTGIVQVYTENGMLLEMAMSYKTHQLLIDDPDELVCKVNAIPAWEYVGSLLDDVGFKPPDLHNNAHEIGWFQALPQDPGVMALCTHYIRSLRISLNRGNQPNWKIPSEDWQQTIKFNKAKWKSYWSNCPQVHLPEDPWLCRFYKFALYKFACATDPSGVACGLQGPWVEEYQKTPWQGDYHFNVNIQQIYTLALSIGATDHMLPLFDMLESKPFMTVMQSNAKNLLGIEDGFLLTHAVDDRGMQCGGIGVGSALDFACSGWVAQLYWLYYQYTLDITFLRNRALPFMQRVMRVYEAVIIEHEGRLSIPLSISAEYGFIFNVKIDGQMRKQIAGRDSSNQLMCAHMLTDALIQACDILNVTPSEKWINIQQRLPRYTVDDTTGEEHIILWEGQDLEVCHRHHSHLANVYPFMTYDPNDTQEASIVNNTIDHWIQKGMGQWSEWCYPWAAIIHARMGMSESPIQLLQLWRSLFFNEGWATVYLPRFRGLTMHRRNDMDKPRQSNEIMQLDGTMAGATAVLEMLVHDQAGVIYLFRGIPEAWCDASFKDICLPGMQRISAAMKNGKLDFVSIKGPTVTKVIIVFKGHAFEVTVIKEIQDLNQLALCFSVTSES